MVSSQRGTSLIETPLSWDKFVKVSLQFVIHDILKALQSYYFPFHVFQYLVWLHACKHTYKIFKPFWIPWDFCCRLWEGKQNQMKPMLRVVWAVESTNRLTEKDGNLNVSDFRKKPRNWRERVVLWCLLPKKKCSKLLKWVFSNPSPQIFHQTPVPSDPKISVLACHRRRQCPVEIF